MIEISRIEKNNDYIYLYIKGSASCHLSWKSSKGHIVYPETKVDLVNQFKIIFDYNKFKRTSYELVNEDGYVINISEENQFRNQKFFKVSNHTLTFTNLSVLLKIKFQINKTIDFKNKKLKTGAKIRILYWLTQPFFFRKKIILFGERQDTMSDNSSYLFFNYYNKTYDNGFYLYNNHHDKKVIKINSLKHILYFLNSKVCVNAYDIERYMTFQGYGKRGLLETFGDILQYKKVFLQHGVFYNDISSYIDKDKIHFDSVVVSTEHEKNFLLNHHYTNDEIITSGLPRFNKLIDKSDSETAIDILIMPTWRSYITSEEEFLESDYFKKYQELLNKLCVDYPHKRIVFFQHYELKKYNHLFSNRTIEIQEDNQNIPELLMHSKLLITDYSSVLFDFNVMNKRVILYQFDSETFFNQHTKKPLIDLDEYDQLIKIEHVDELHDNIINYEVPKNVTHPLVKYKPNDDVLLMLCHHINTI